MQSWWRKPSVIYFNLRKVFCDNNILRVLFSGIVQNLPGTNCMDGYCEVYLKIPSGIQSYLRQQLPQQLQCYHHFIYLREKTTVCKVGLLLTVFLSLEL
jgi:hypothetical protein